jgi:hypothetical protein
MLSFGGFGMVAEGVVMTGMELTIIIAVVFILFAFERVYARVDANRQTTETINCLETIANLLREIRDEAREHRADLDNHFANVQENSAIIANTLNDVDMALHGDRGSDASPARKELNCLRSIEENLNSLAFNIDLELKSRNLELVV